MSMFTPTEKGTTIRQPSTANLMIDSQDRDQTRYAFAGDFQINKRQSIMNGFFTRVGLTEHVLEWSYPNLNEDLSSNVLDISFNGVKYPIVLTDGFYNVEEALDAVVAKGNALAISGLTFSVITPTNALPFAALGGSAPFNILPSGLANLLIGVESTAPDAPPSAAYAIIQPDLRPFRYLDFVSEKLTYNQDLKDDATNETTRNVLSRWYFAFDQPPALDGYGYPILMGYEQFVLRRLFNPPKQIRWDTTMPLGQLEFKVYVDPTAADVWGLPGGLLVGEKWGAYWEWLATLQVSEV